MSQKKQGCFGCSGCLGTIVIVILILMATGGLFIDDDEKDITSKNKEIEESTSVRTETIDIPTYSIEMIDDVSFTNVKRYVYQVVIKEKTNIEQLQYLSEIIVNIAKDKTPFNALAIHYYDNPVYIGHGCTLGDATFTPDGDWAKANTVPTGSYDRMKFVYELLEKDWNKQLSEEEVKIFKDWYLEYDKEYNRLSSSGSTDLPNEDKIDKIIAKKYSKTKEDIYEIMLRHLTWIYDDTKK